MKVGDYVRTDIGEIRKVVRVTDDLYVLDKDVVFAHKDKIRKSSPNIIDLIEVGDYVNGSYVEGFIEKNKFQNKLIITEAGMIDNNDIKSIVTKNQFKNMEYEVK